MPDHYYSQQPTSDHDYQSFSTEVAGQFLSFATDAGVFSKDRMDFGSRLLVETFVDQVQAAPDALLELGSGYGPIAISLAKVYPTCSVMGLELNQRALELAKQNALANQVTNVTFELADVLEWQRTGDFSHVVTNPPIRAGKAVIQAFADQACRALRPGGELWLVIQKKQGAPSMEAYLNQHFDQVDRVNRSKGYWILRAIKKA